MSASMQFSQDPCDELFVQALTTIKALTNLSNTSNIPKPPLKDRISLYGIYKQATEGDTNRQEPDPHLDYAAHTKWTAWKLNEGVSPNEAKKRYVRQLITLLNAYGTEYSQVSQLRDSIQLYWDQYNSKARKYGEITYLPPPASGVIVSSNNIMRSHSPAASLYRIASTGLGKPSSKLNRSRNPSFSGTTLNTAVSSPPDHTNTPSLAKWPETSARKHDNNISTAYKIPIRALSQSTGHIPTGQNGETGNLTTLQLIFRLAKLLLAKAYTLATTGFTRDLLVVLAVLALQKSPLFKKSSVSLQKRASLFIQTAANLLRGRSLK